MKVFIKIIKVALIVVAILVLSFASAILGIYIVFNNDNSKIPLLNKIDVSKKVKNTSVVVKKRDEVHIDKDIQLQGSYKDTQQFLSYIALKKDKGPYLDSDIIGFGVNITGDGYILTNVNAIPQIKKDTKYVIILNDSKVFDVKNIIYDKYGFIIFKIDGQKMDVPSFTYYDDINIGATVYSNNGPFGIEVDTIKSKKDGIIQLSNNQMSNKYGIFDLSNKLVGFYGNDNNLYSSNYLKNILYSLTLNKNTGKILRPSLNIEYSNYTNIISEDNTLSGFYITKVPLQNSYNLMEGDIIKKIDGYAVKDSLDYILQNYKVGDTLDFDIIRGNKEIEVKVELK